MRIAHVFNMANDGWFVCKGLRNLGVEAELFIQRPSHVASLPQWEEADVDLENIGNLFDPNWTALQRNWQMPSWVHVLDLRKENRLYQRMQATGKFLLELGDYDLVVGHTPFASMALRYTLLHRRRYAVYDAGWIRYLWLRREGYALARWGYRNASTIFFTNVDTFNMFRDQGYSAERLAYSPFAIDTDQYTPYPANETPYPEHDPVFFSPSRQDWAEKGNDRLILAFARYLKRRPSALMLLVEWGDAKDLNDAKHLISETRIQDSVRWLPLSNKRRLIELYNRSTAVFDQFIFGAFGTTAPEAMSCAKPVVGYAEPHYWNALHGSVPPILNCRTAEQIYDRMVELEDPSLGAKLGRAGREWVLETCSLSKVARIHLANYRKILRS